MEQQSVGHSPAAVAKPQAFGRLFPLIWIGVAGVTIVVVQFVGQSQSIKVLATIGIALAMLMGLAIWFLCCSNASRRVRWTVFLAVLAAMLITTKSVQLVNDGALGIVGWRFRWTPRPDEQLGLPEAAGVAADWQPTPADYPRFLGVGYWPEVKGVRLARDWQVDPPREVWRRPIGAGWSSFAIVGDYAISQEQRGQQELVVCYRVAGGGSPGEIVWVHADEARFDPATIQGGMGGVGPRATPTIVDGRVYTQGATGIVNCLDATSGKVIWSANTLEKFGADLLVWGKSGSPLVFDDVVIINVGAPEDVRAQESYNASLVAMDRETGDVRWTAGNRITAYASPVLAEFQGERQVLQINQDFITSHRASDGEVLWEHPWPGNSSSNATCPQPVPLDGDRLLLCKGYGIGASLLQVTKDAEQYALVPLWEPEILQVLKTKFANVVLRDGYVYGLDGTMLQCVELETGAEQWKKRRSPDFGHGEILLIGDTILVLTERGELVLVEATPEKYRELASLQALDDAEITWNNPSFAPPYLLIRNGREAVCYKLPLVESPSP